MKPTASATREISLFHHVYSSIGGYKTLYVSKEFSKDFRGVLEEVATKVYSTLTRSTMLLGFRHGGYLWWTKAFFHGSDHVGRPRKCVHTILVKENAVRDLPFFSPLDFESNQYFVGVQHPLENIYAHLKSQGKVSVYSLEERYNFLREMEWTLEDFSIFYGAMMSHQHQISMVSNSQKWKEGVAMLSGFLPWNPRFSLAFCQGGIFESFPVPLHLFWVNQEYWNGGKNSWGHLVEVNLEDRSISQNFPSPNRMVDFVTENLVSDPEQVFKLLYFIERHSIEVTSTNDMYASLISAFEETRHEIGDSGEITLENNPMVWVKNMLKYSQAGYENVSLNIAYQCVQLLQKKHPLTSLEELEKRIEYLYANYQEFQSKKDNILVVLSNLLIDYFNQANSKTNLS